MVGTGDPWSPPLVRNAPRRIVSVPLATALIAGAGLGCDYRSSATSPDPGWDAGAQDLGDPGVDAVRLPDVTMTWHAPDGGAYVGPHGGSVDLLRFAAFGDVRPPNQDDTANYPSAIVASVMDGIATLGVPFAVASGDYMFAATRNEAGVNAQLDLLLAAESRYAGRVFHALGNHECTGATASNCPLGNETPNVRAFHDRLASDYPMPWFDFVVQTSRGDAHFIATAPNAWGPQQAAWLASALQQPALYTIVIAHEEPGPSQGPGSLPIEDAIRARPGGVTLRIYGHSHTYDHPAANAVVTGNGGAPLSNGRGAYGFVGVVQREDANLVVTAYEIGTPPMVADSFVLTPGGALTR